MTSHLSPIWLAPTRGRDRRRRTHFLAEYWTFRQRILRYLHEQCGFTIFALEFGISEAITLAPWLDGQGSVDD